MRLVNFRIAAGNAFASVVCMMVVGCGGGDGGEAAGTTTSVTGSENQAASLSTAMVQPTSAEVGPTMKAEALKLLRPAVAPGSGYFVDALAGSDSNVGSFAAPWKTLSKLVKVKLKSGEGIYVRCGGVWRESLTLTATQLVDGSKITGYGSDCVSTNKPRITGADDFTGGWTKSGNIWSRRVTAGLPKIGRLLINGSLQRTAQWPDFGGIGHEYAITAPGAASSSTKIAMSAANRALLGNKDIAGAAVHIRTTPWLVENLTVGSADATSLKLRGSTTQPIDAGDGYVLQDKLWMVDAPGEFFHDTANGMLYVYPSDSTTQANLNSASVEGMVRSIGLLVSDRSNLALSGLAVEMTTGVGVTVNSAPSAVLDGVDASNNLGAGIRLNLATAPAAPARGATIRNGRYLGNALSGLDAGNVPNADIVSNVLSGTGMGQAEWSNAAIVAGEGALVDRNLIQQSAFRAILFSGFGGSRITNNTVSDYCVRLSDCAAIYTVNSSNRRTGTQVSTVENNRVMGSTLNLDGTVGGQILAGIYLDDMSRSVTVRGNVLMNMPMGIYVHNSSLNTIEANKVWLTTDVALMAKMDRLGADLMTGNVFRGNQLAPASSVVGAYPELPQISSSRAIRFLHLLYGPASMTSGGNIFTGNQVVAFNGDTATMAEVGFGASTGWISSLVWRAFNPAEVAPSAPATFATYHSTLGAELLPTGNFDAGLGDWDKWFSVTGTGGIAVPLSGISGCDGECIKLVAGKAGDRLSSPNFRMVAGAQYSISFTAVFGGKTSINHPNIARPDTPYDSYVSAEGIKSRNTSLSGNAGDILKYEAFFTSTSSDSARINLRISDVGVPVAFDSVSLRPVIGYSVSNFADWGALASAPIDSTKTVACADLGWPVGCAVIDIDGNAVGMPVAIPAGVTKLLLLANSSWRN